MSRSIRLNPPRPNLAHRTHDQTTLHVPLPLDVYDTLLQLADSMNQKPESLASIWIGAAIVGITSRLENKK